jgi:hypothetical protein
VKDVLADCKVKVYLKAKLPPVALPAPVLAPLAVPAVVSSAKDNEIVLKSELIDISAFTVPMIAADIKHRLLVRCPQIPKAGLIEVPIS